MPVVPTEQNKVGIAGVTGAKLEAGDFSGSGLQAIGSGLQQVGGGLGELEKAQEAEDDAAIKRAYNHYAETVRPFVYEGNDAIADKQGGDAVAMAPIATQRVHDAADSAAAGLKPRLQGNFRATIAPRVDQDIRWIQQRAGAATKVSQSQQSDQVIANCARDAIAQHGSFAFGQTVATGVKQVAEQVAAGILSAEAGVAKTRDYLSGIHLGVITGMATSDPVLGTGLLQQQGASMTPEHHHEASQAIQGPLDQARGIADVDSLGFAQSPVAPETPPGDLGTTGQRMLAITPQSTAPADPGAGAAIDSGAAASQAQSGASAQPGSSPAGAGNLPALLQHYGGDAAKAWAAWRLGNDAVDALVATHGGTWFGALPDDTRRAVAANMGLLRAAISPRAAPAPGDRAALAGQIDAQPWRDDRKRNAHEELHTRIGLADRRLTEVQKGAADRSFQLAETLGPKFISINQIPPADRLALDDDTRAALALRADRNVHPVTVPPHGDVAMALNRMAATDPQAFAKQDLRLFRDRMSQPEYEALGRVQQAWKGYPPGTAGINHQRTVEKVRASGLDDGETSGTVGTGRGNQSGGEGPSIGKDYKPPAEDLSADHIPEQPVNVQGKSDDPTNDEQELRDIVNSAAVERQNAEYFSADGHRPADGEDTGEASLQPAVYLRFADGPEATAGAGGRFQTIAAQDVTAAGPTAKGSRPPVDPTLPTGTPSNHQPGMYRHATTGKTMAGNQIVRKPDVQAENSRQLRSDLKNPFILAFLDLLSWTEGTTKYMWKTRHLSSPPLTDLGSFPYSFKQPVGRYQIEPNTYDEIAVARLGLKDFSPESQDMTAAMQLRMLHASDALLKGDLAGAIRAASGPWASVPVSAQENHSALHVIQNGAWKVNPKTGKFVFQVAKDYPDVVSKYKFFLKCYGVPDSQINALKY